MERELGDISETPSIPGIEELLVEVTLGGQKFIMRVWTTPGVDESRRAQIEEDIKHDLALIETHLQSAGVDLPKKAPDN